MLSTQINLFISNHYIFSPLLFILFRTIFILIPILPGAAMDFAGIPLFGWFHSFIYAEIGIMAGSCIAFWIGRKLREPLLKKFITIKKINDYESSISHNKKFWTLILFRIPANSVLSYINYVIGLTNISFRTFFITTLIGNIPGMLLFYYFSGMAYNLGFYYFLSFILFFIVLAFIVYRYRKIIKSRLKIMKSYIFNGHNL